MTMGWGLEVASELVIKGAALWPPPAQLFAFSVAIPRLIDDGVVDENGENETLCMILNYSSNDM